MIGLLRTADEVLRRAGWTADATRWHAALPRLIACIVCFSCLFGAFMGAYRGFVGQTEWLLQITFSATKVPLLLCGSFVLTVPPFFVFTSLVGLRSDLGSMIRALAVGQAAFAIALASLAPMTIVVYASTTDYRIALISSTMLFAIAGFAGQWILRWHCRPLIEKQPRWRWMLLLWAGLYSLVAIQLAWLLRPFFGAADMPVTFLRPQAWDNAYVTLVKLVWRTFFG